MPTSAVVMRAVLFFIFMIMSGQVAEAQSGTAKDQTLFTTIDIFENGDALWTSEMRTPLTTQSGINEWNMTMNDANRSKKYLIEFNESINKKLHDAENFSHRPMKAQSFDISYETIKIQPNAYGMIRLSFEWVNFSRIEGTRIIIGDAFSEEMVPSSDNVLIIKIPEGYDIENVAPSFDKRDDNRLIWDGTMYRSFGKGEPSITLSKKIISHDSFPVMLVILVVAGGLIIFSIYMDKSVFIRSYEAVKTALAKKDSAPVGNNTERTGAPPDNIDEIITASDPLTSSPVGTADIAPVTDNQEANVPQPEHIPTGLPSIDEEILGDEEMIERYLIKFGGQAYQSDIVTESGLSKSKISIVLAKMKDEGRILKIRKGKENIIRLAKK